MTYATKEKSTKDAAPVECYKFLSAFGDFYYTNNNEAVTMGADTFEPLNISRSSIDTSAGLDSIITVDISLPSNDPLAILYCYLKSPSNVTVEILRGHRGDDWSTDYITIWKGTAVGSSVDGHKAIIQTGSLIQARLGGNVSNRTYQASCNHILYDERCKVDPSGFTFSATVAGVLGGKITLVTDSSADSALIGGTITVDRTGEFRNILDNLSDVVSVAYEFIDLAAGDTVTIVHGCDHFRMGDCKNKFNNVVNYGGMDWIPVTNPFSELKDQNIAQINTKTSYERYYNGSAPENVTTV